MDIEEQTTIKSLLAAGFSATAIAKRIDRDHKTVLAFARQDDTKTAVADLREDLADAYEGLARRMIDSITDEDITKLNAYQRTVASGIAFDKMRLHRNQSTSNQSVFFRIVDEAPDLPEENS
jgi:hypothetical protein